MAVYVLMDLQYGAPSFIKGVFSSLEAAKNAIPNIEWDVKDRHGVLKNGWQSPIYFQIDCHRLNSLESISPRYLQNIGAT